LNRRPGSLSYLLNRRTGGLAHLFGRLPARLSGAVIAQATKRLLDQVGGAA
jgi:hypothetical protein